MANVSTKNIEYCIDSFEENGGFHGEDVKAKWARKELAAMKKRIKDLEHEIVHFLGDCDCDKFPDP